jgi:hypothetical protein
LALRAKKLDLDTPAGSILQKRLGLEEEPGATTQEQEPENDAAPIAPVLIMPSTGDMLFASLDAHGQRPTSLVGSMVVHVVAAAVLLFGFAYKPPSVRIEQAHYTLRQLDLLMPPENRKQSPPRIPYPKSHSASSAAEGRTEQSQTRPEKLVPPGPQTLIQADLLNPITLPQPIPVPQVVIWTPSKTVVKKITPPLPQKPTSADVIPVLDRPNQELTLADVNLASSKLPSVKMPVAPSTTSPVTIHTPSKIQQPPATASQLTAMPTPASVLSLSDLKMIGSAALPPVNESPASTAKGALAPGKAQNPSDQGGKGSLAAKPGLGGSGQSAAGAANQSAPGSGSGKPETSSSLSDADTGSDGNGRATTTAVAMPKGGQFGSVIVNDDLEQQFPELEGAWTGRIAYTAYLHVGLPKPWIMQFSLPRNTPPAAPGTNSRLEAPWPFEIVRPNLPPGSVDADSVMIRGYVDEDGRFQNLSVVFPQPFSNAQFVIAALQKWQFRPAQHNGLAAKVEVLLIIPEDLQ